MTGAGEGEQTTSEPRDTCEPSYSEMGVGNRDLFLAFRNAALVYCEDAGWEEFYTRLLRRLDLGFEIEDVFCLGGKEELKKRRREKSEKPRLFLFDKDFDDLIGKVVSGTDVVYLPRYSIENFFLEEGLFVSYVVDQKKGLRQREVAARLDFASKLERFTAVYGELCRYFVFSQKFRLGVAGSKLDVTDFCKEDGELNEEWYDSYKRTIREEVAKKQAWLLEGGQFEMQLERIFDPAPDFSSIADGSEHCHFPGKHIFDFLMLRCKAEFDIDIRDRRYAFMMISADRIDMQRFEELLNRMGNSLRAQAA